MKKQIIKQTIGALLISFLMFGMGSCNLGEIGWPTDASYNRLFTPIGFTAQTVDATSLTLIFTKVVDAKKYVLEISDDSLKFNNIVRREEVLADTIKPYLTSTSAPLVQYKKVFADLNANSQYSIRLIAINKDSSLRSSPVQLAFKTKAENIFGKIDIQGNGATIRWRPTNRVTFLKLTKSTQPNVNILTTDSMISASELRDTTKLISGLEVGTYYTAKICYKDGNVVRERGVTTFKTPGTAGSALCILKTTDLIADSLTAYLAAGKTNVTFLFNNGETYNLGSVTVPAGFTRITFTAPTGTPPIVNLVKVVPSASMDGFLFENIKMEGTATYLFSIASAFQFTDFTFTNCYLNNYTSVVLLKNTVGCVVQNVTIENCVVTNNGGYGVINVAGSSTVLSNLKITKSTFVNMSTQLMDVRNQIANLEVSNCLFYNNSTTSKITQLIRFASNDLTPLKMVIDKCVFAGNNGGTAVNSFNSNYPNTASFAFNTCSRTNDFPVGIKTGQMFTNIKIISNISSDLFTDPSNNIFFVKQSIVFDGKGVIGDPRWW